TRIIRTLKAMGIRSVAVYHDADAQSLHVQQADEAVCLGAGTVSETYLDIDRIIQIAVEAGAEAIHPGYGFLSENTDFVTRCEAAKISFIGPTADQIAMFGLKHEARRIADEAQVPLVPGSPLLTDLESAIAWASEVHYPVMLKSTAGGGGIGMQVCESEQDLIQAWESVRRLSANYFANDGVFLEKYIRQARHIEVQIIGDGQGSVISLGERDCSAQRRNQKVIEETPAPGLSDALRSDLHQTAERLMASVNYRNAGTVEFILDAETGSFYFLEVNTRLQVEHGVTEMVWGVDLVDWMIRLAASEMEPLADHKRNLMPKGHAIQVRVYAEDPCLDFQPSAGLLTEVDWPEVADVRIDHWLQPGLEVTALFDPMLAKVITLREDRTGAIASLKAVLADIKLYGVETNLDYVGNILNSAVCQSGQLLTRTLGEMTFHSPRIHVLSSGTQTTIQDFPGRTGFWHIGIPPSGPMDSVSFRLANRLLNNASSAAGMEITLNGPTLRFDSPTRIVLTGATIEAKLDDEDIAMHRVVTVHAGQTLMLGKVVGAGARTYLAVHDGFYCPDYLGSKATFTLGQFGGHAGRALRAGDVLRLNEPPSRQAGDPGPALNPTTPATSQVNTCIPEIHDSWTLRVIYGPHGAPDFFTDNDIKTFFEHEWQVHYNSSRTGIRLIGPKPEWARETGGEAGLHPSNIHDNAYAFGTVDFTGDMPVILGPDGPSLGGFVCPATVIQADLWKLGQLKAGAKVRFIPISYDQAVSLEAEQTKALENLQPLPDCPLPETTAIEHLPSPVIHQTRLGEDTVTCRLAGDHFLLVELGPLELDIAIRFKIHALMRWLETNPTPGIKELTPGIRSLQIHYDSQVLSLDRVIAKIDQALEQLQDHTDMSVPARIVHIPLSWDDEACRIAIEKYTQSVRPNAPWCPSNLEFIRRINGLPDLAAVKEIVFSASYLVMGLGDVYLGAPVATPLDPRHRTLGDVGGRGR
ncbi:MAG: urea carboxylase, partial [Pseudomonadales bacterium]|nr:urea carboxylase [Pseudomonadales bacterium]